MLESKDKSIQLYAKKVVTLLLGIKIPKEGTPTCQGLCRHARPSSRLGRDRGRPLKVNITQYP